MNAAGAGPDGVVCVGMSCLDVVQRVVEPVVVGRKSVSTSAELAAGGPAANAAVTAAALGRRSWLISALGVGPAAGLVRDDLTWHRVRVLDCAPPDWSIAVATCVVDAAGERTVVSPGGWVGPAPELDLSDHAREVVARNRRHGVLLIDGHHVRLARQVLDRWRADPGHGPVLVDAGSVKPHVEQWLPEIDVLAASADYGLGLGLDAEATLAHGLAAGCRAAVVTAGPGPVRWALADGRQGTVHPPTVHAVDTLGAGDAFHGALAAALVPGAAATGSWIDRFPAAVDLAVRAASHRVTCVGARTWLTSLDPRSSYDRSPR